MLEKNSFIEEKILPIAAKMSANNALMAIRDGMTLSLPLIIAGSFFMIIASFPVKAWTDLLSSLGITTYLWKGVDSSFGLVGFVAAFGIAYSYARSKGVDGVSAGVINLSSLIMVTPFLQSEAGSGYPVSYMGSKALFVAMILGLLNATAFAWFIKRNITIKMPDMVPPAIARSFTALIPGFVILSFWLFVFALVDNSQFINIHNIILIVFGKPLSFLGGSLFGTLIAIALNSLFWFCGIHGGSVVGSVMNPIWLINTDANRMAFQAGEKILPNIITGPFLDCFVWMGGGGATLGLVIVIAMIAKKRKSSKVSKTIAPLTLTPGIFNINEPAMFGLPIVMNVALLIPFVIAPMANAVICYFAMKSGLVPYTIGAAVHWTTPALISGFLATGSIKGSILQLVCIIVDIAIYYSFYMVVEKANQKIEEGE